MHVYIYLLSNPSSIFIAGVTEEHTGCIGTDLVLVWCILSLINRYWSCRGIPRHGIPDIGMLMIAANWALGVVSPLLGQALLVGIVLPTPGQALLWALSCPRWVFRHCQGQEGVPYDFRYPYGCQLLLSIFCCWHYLPSGGCYRLLALLLLATHGTIFLGCSWHYFCWHFMALLLSWQWQ